MPKKRMIAVAIVLVIGVGLDQWSKIWADDHLGTQFHPVPISIAESDDGKTLSEVANRLLDLEDGTPQSVLYGGFRRLTHKAIGTDRAFPSDVKCERPRTPSEIERGVRCVAAYVVFHHESLDKPPRRVPNRNQETIIREHANDTVAEYVGKAFPYLSEDARDRVIANHVYRIAIRVGQNPDGATYHHWDAGAETNPNHVVKAGELYVALRHNVLLIDSEEGPPLLQLQYAENPGAAWSLFADKSESFRRYFFIGVSIGAITLISFLLHGLTREQGLAAIAFSTILSGAIGNFIDRLRFNYVIDFIDMHPGFSYPTYNVADIAITVGVILLLIEWLLKGKKSFLRSTGKSKNEKASA